MHAMGQFPLQFNEQLILENIHETVIISDASCHIRWMNAKAVETLEPLIKMYGISSCEELIGMHMDTFHTNPHHQHAILTSLTSTHRARINIKDTYIAETVIHPIDSQDGKRHGYLLMLLDVTRQAEAEQEREQLIKELSTPFLKVWDEIIAVPIVGKMNIERGRKLMEAILTASVKEQVRYVLIDLSSLTSLDEDNGHYINMIHEGLRLIGTTCIIVGISSQMAISLVHSDYNWKTFSTVRQSIAYILELEGKTIAPIGQ
ncbi:anti-anti-sigma factor [Priestia megaterium]|nr:anti-anti-sigma factor [Priestia megaterium]